MAPPPDPQTQDDDDELPPAPAPYQPPAQKPFMPQSQTDQLKAALYPYLVDKMRRRGGVTSNAAYSGTEKALNDQGLFIGGGGAAAAFAKAASQIGTLGGKSANTGVISDTVDAVNRASQQRFLNELALRKQEEDALGTDTNIAKLVTGVDEADKQRKYVYEKLAADMQAKQGEQDIERYKATHPPLQQATNLDGPNGPQVLNPSPVPGRGGYKPGGAQPGTHQVWRPQNPANAVDTLVPDNDVLAPPGMRAYRNKRGESILKPLAEGATVKGANLNDKELEKGQGLNNAIDLVDSIIRDKPAVHTGTFANIQNLGAQKLDIDDPRVSEFRSRVGTQLADYIKSISGAAVSDQERAFLLNNVPNMSDSDQTFLAKIKAVRERMGAIRDRYEQGLRGMGKNTAPLGRTAPQGAAGSDPKIADYALKNGLPYSKAEQILRGRGYVPQP